MPTFNVSGTISGYWNYDIEADDADQAEFEFIDKVTRQIELRGAADFLDQIILDELDDEDGETTDVLYPSSQEPPSVG